MSKVVLLDSGPLGMLAHPRADPAIVTWASNLGEAGIRLVIPEIADYEVRRELIRAKLAASVQRLDELKIVLEYLPLTTAMMLRAAQIWAQARQAGVPTAHDEALDGDVILAAQAIIASEVGIESVVATRNVGHLSRFVNAQIWHAII